MAALRALLRWRRRLGPAPAAQPARRLWAGGGAGAAGLRRWRRELGWAAGGALAGYVGYRLSERRREASREPAAAEPGGARALLSIPVAAAAKETVTENRSDLEDLHLYATPREQRFRRFASLEFEGQLYMTPYDFIQAVTSDEPKRAKKWRSLSKQELNQILMETPPVWKGSSKLFRNLNEKGVISYTEYLFLLCILTKPHAGFRIAFNMFDTDGNEMVDKKEFLVLQEIFRKKNEKRERKGDEEKRALLRTDDMSSSLSDTTLLVHFFGKRGKAELNFEDFYRFMDNLQTEVLEIEFLSYSNGMNTISEEDFAHILLRYTNVENTSSYLENMRCRIPEEKGITFDEFRSFFQFLNNLEDFTIAMQMYNFASRSIGQDEFKRAVYVATGVKLSPHLVNTVFKIFDVDRDDQLSYKEFIGIMKDRLNRGFRETPKYGWKEYYSCVMTVTSEHLRDLWKQFRRRDTLR
ncbi:calcium uptake protein 3, mitochondrial isoform X6 [Falco biarmicus]|uniref:calcium uptake protein 3, mitochondrial isoform X6 n=1 Tax=Falco rusticolus TaxID=120794 RepID=UPI0018867B41|nr:calcium uptake protein 3, mitochondrial isoform X6 [Falco rusticolus]XP_040452349.1 calcium uptake protein 3, mitochondrial isoform X6 [Falco naumanni]XP_055559205.1 calcium uptake protein 3, mitochondrial isoform X6 [Falco cherrug]XP_055651289.1 calcium uptake protein 3, mitochondrial isoform X6 [Falco peregrinus]XP_056190430.1 calcium uptake protein 3, mitochondrial isoform X6 [Falco biarmicus]